MIRIVHANASWRDQDKIVDYLDSVHAEQVARRFLLALDKTIEFIAEFPDLGNPSESSNPRNAGLRFRLVKGIAAQETRS